MTKTITLPVETHKKMEDYFSFCKDYTEEMNDYLTDYKHLGFTKNQMVSNILDWDFYTWFAENWENKRYQGYDEPVPTTKEMDRFIRSTYFSGYSFPRVKINNHTFIYKKNAR